MCQDRTYRLPTYLDFFDIILDHASDRQLSSRRNTQSEKENKAHLPDSELTTVEQTIIPLMTLSESEKVGNTINGNANLNLQ